ncbi:MAG: hypothetical protein QNK16_06250, partial [Woeseiaceae bacterium]|nr:hypothetical protein [Woeseiaceae bacterium]MDX2607962.1 hypothetical protein [Woeseiaceae bacterium]
MRINQARQNIPAGGINTCCLRIVVEQRRITRSDDFATIRNDQNAKLMDAGLSRGMAGEPVEYSFRSVYRAAKAQEKNCSKRFNLDFRSPDSFRFLSSANFDSSNLAMN